MADPSLDLQEAIVGALRNASPPIANGRVYDAVPPEAKRVTATGAAWPYVSYGPSQVVSDDADCITGYVVSVQIDVWSKTIGKVEVKDIAGEIRTVLHDADLTLDNHALVLIEHRNTRDLDDPVAGIKHAAMEFRALVDGVGS